MIREGPFEVARTPRHQYHRCLRQPSTASAQLNALLHSSLTRLYQRALSYLNVAAIATATSTATFPLLQLYVHRQHYCHRSDLEVHLASASCPGPSYHVQLLGPHRPSEQLGHHLRRGFRRRLPDLRVPLGRLL